MPLGFGTRGRGSRSGVNPVFTQLVRGRFALSLAPVVATGPPSSAPYSPQPGFLSDRQLAALQENVLSSLPWRCELLDKVAGISDGAGRMAITWPVLHTYNCDIEVAPISPEMVQAQEIAAVAKYLITLPWDAVVNPKQRLRINGVTYEIESRADNWTDQSCVVVTAQRVE